MDGRLYRCLYRYILYASRRFHNLTNSALCRQPRIGHRSLFKKKTEKQLCTFYEARSSYDHLFVGPFIHLLAPVGRTVAAPFHMAASALDTAHASSYTDIVCGLPVLQMPSIRSDQMCHFTPYRQFVTGLKWMRVKNLSWTLNSSRNQGSLSFPASFQPCRYIRSSYIDSSRHGNCTMKTRICDTRATADVDTLAIMFLESRQVRCNIPEGTWSL